MLVTYRCFFSKTDFIQAVMLRFEEVVMSLDPQKQPSRVRCYVLLRHWVREFWQLDFESDGKAVNLILLSIDRVWRNVSEMMQPADKQLLLRLRGLVAKDNAVSVAF